MHVANRLDLHVRCWCTLVEQKGHAAHLYIDSCGSNRTKTRNSRWIQTVEWVECVRKIVLDTSFFFFRLVLMEHVFWTQLVKLNLRSGWTSFSWLQRPCGVVEAGSGSLCVWVRLRQSSPSMVYHQEIPISIVGDDLKKTKQNTAQSTGTSVWRL